MLKGVLAYLECRGDMVHMECAGCPTHCHRPGLDIMPCPAVCIPGCACPRDTPYFLGDDRCGTEDQCPGRLFKNPSEKEMPKAVPKTSVQVGYLNPI